MFSTLNFVRIKLPIQIFEVGVSLLPIAVLSLKLNSFLLTLIIVVLRLGALDLLNEAFEAPCLLDGTRPLLVLSLLLGNTDNHPGQLLFFL